MKLKFKCLLFLLLPLLVNARNGGLTYKKTIVKEFTVSDNAKLSISNKYGKIIFHAWNKNVIKATITITGFGKNDDQAASIANMVDVDADQSGGNSVSMRTAYNPSKGGSWFSWGGKMDSKDYVNIDYDIYIPQSLQKLMVANQFGDVIADRFAFAAVMELNYCTFDIREAANLTFKINYCDKGRIGKAERVVVQGNYSNIKADQIEALEVKSNYSSYAVDRLGSLNISSTYDDYKIQHVGEVNGRCTYSDVRLNELTQSVNMTTTYGSMKIDKVGTGFKQADIQMTYSDLKMVFSRRQPLSIEANLVHGDLKTGGLEVKNVVSNRMNANLNYQAQAGGGSESSPYIKIKGVNTDVKLDAY
ncbi:hypothetical protein [Chitinophaga sp. 212800010-3]|uniref:hypothetical protein n=1 Tax=unclassified Chitinophaga TaxID=2619133 RepID=UPI002DF07F5C|nr:DUF4097 domain-containing protein [Chitinophaga sp. 212800010-3]